jgi:hypothetical protein
MEQNNKFCNLKYLMIAALFLSDSTCFLELQEVRQVSQFGPSGNDDLGEDCRNLGFGCSEIE